MSGISRHVRAFTFALVLTLAPIGAARAASLEIRFEGTVKSVTTGVVGGSLQVGAPVEGRILIETDGQADRSPDPHWGSYFDGPPYPVLSYELTIGDYSIVAAAPDLDNGASVFDDYLWHPTQAVDLFGIQSPMTGDAVNGLAPYVAAFHVFTTNDRIAGDAIPTVAEIAAFAADLAETNEGTVNYLRFSDSSEGAFERIDWNLDRFSVVPEPRTPVLVLMGFLGLLARLSPRPRSRACA